ncbi:hypothetical protein GCM10017668_02890 [Streptomyces tuirus]|uniref:Uncharacterized protein n=1 Tax=Streptomyces tuirus TaxID=68278 RepID=A0A7G1N9J2_9ACTN|nr:hypothetical protein GCM10017668_02890 [Streptomyces tuirus]
MAHTAAHLGGDRLGAEVVTVPHGLEQRDAGGRHPEAGTAQLLGWGRVPGCGHASNLATQTRVVQENERFNFGVLRGGFVGRLTSTL